MGKNKKNQTRVVPVKEVTAAKSVFSVPLFLWLLIAISLLTRFAHLHFDSQNPFFGPLILDPKYYQEWALQILSGDFIGQGVFYGLPLYPFFLALCYKFFGVTIVAVKVVQALLGASTIFFIYKTGEKLHSEKTGLAAALLATLYGPLFFHEQIFIPEALAIPLYAAGFYLACVLWESRRVGHAILLGLVLGLAALAKAGVIPFVLIFSAVFLMREVRSSDKKWAPAFLFPFFFFLVLSPVTAHNWIYGKDWVPLTSHGGFNLYIGNNPAAEGVFLAPEGTGSNVDAQIQDSRVLAEREMGRELKPSEVSRYWSEKAWKFIRENPGRFGMLFLKKLALFFDAREISDVEDYEYSKQFNPFLRLPWLTFAFVGPLFILGLFAVAQGRVRHRWILWAWLIPYITSICFFFINARYRLPLLGVILTLSGIALMELIFSIQKKEWKKVSVAVVLLVAGVALTQARLVGTNWAKDDVNAGDIYTEQKNWSAAEHFYKSALEKDPTYTKANLALGVLFTKQGLYTESKDYYLKAIASDPKNSQAYNNLGLWFDREGDLEQAKQYFLKAIEFKPSSSQAHNNLGMVYGKTGELDLAIAELEASLKINPLSERAHTNLGLIYYKQGNRVQAQNHWERALVINPDFPEARKALGLLKSRQ